MGVGSLLHCVGPGNKHSQAQDSYHRAVLALALDFILSVSCSLMSPLVFLLQPETCRVLWSGTHDVG